MAMQYAIISVGVDWDRAEGLAQLKLTIPFDEWKASELKHRMEQQFDVYEVQQAIKRAEEIVKMVIPNTGDI
jgi:hypothetical protein